MKTLPFFLLTLGLVPLAGLTQSPVNPSTGFPAPLPATTTERPTHFEKEGIVVIEAESGRGEWERLEEEGASVIRAVPGRRMIYRVRFAKPGVYYVHMRCRLTSGMIGPAGTVLKDQSTNDAHLTVGGERLYGSDHQTRPEGMRCHSKSLAWWALPKGPGGHTPENIKQNPVVTYLPEAGVYEVALGYRSPGFVVDKIAFTQSPELPTELEE
jgi:hypothetical protein